MKKYIRNKLIFTGTPERLNAIAKDVEDDHEQIGFHRILPLTGDMETDWGIAAEPEELDRILYRNGTILEYSFDTLGGIPLPVFQRLAEQYPDVRMTVHYASEDYGEDCGIYESLEGSTQLSEETPEDPLVFACELWDVDPEEEMQERMINFYEE